MKTVKHDLQVKKIMKRTGSPFFLGPLFIPEMLWTTRMNDLDDVLNKFVKYKVGNFTRVFLLPSSWDAKYNNWATEIFLRDRKGRFILPNPIWADKQMGIFINPVWEAQVINRIKKVVRRMIMLILSLWDNCCFHQRSPGFWSDNFLNPKNNRINTSGHNHAYYLYASNTSVQMQNTGKIVEALTRYMLNKIHAALTRPERKYIAIETCNEGQSGLFWHIQMKSIIDETWGQDCPRWRRFTSTEGEVGLDIRRCFTPVIHKVGNMKRYVDRAPASRCGVSTDGWHEPGEYSDVPIPVQRAKRLLKRAYADGHRLFELLHGHRHIDQRVPKSPHNTTKNRKWYDHSVIDWKKIKPLGKTLLRLTK